MAFTLVGCWLSGCRHQERSTTNDPGEALSGFVLPNEFQIELLASEPLLGDPVDMEIDEFGRLFVVEMPGYPLDKTGTGKVKQLIDRDGDGRMDSCIIFADQLVMPNSLMRWKQGLLVTDAPYVFYLEDRDGDGRADVRDTVLTGFALSNPQHNLNSPVMGIDNWIYLAHEGAVSTDRYEKEFGDSGHEIRYPSHPSTPVLGINANGRSIRFRPDTHQLEETSGHSQFGHTFDSWGRHFLVGNADHVYWEVMPARYLARNPNLWIAKATESISDHGNAAEVFPVTENPQHQLLTDVGVITSACGLTSYQGGIFPAPYNMDVMFVAEPVSNLVHVDKIASRGSSFVASRVLEQKEFLASRDARFRPVNLYTGPDGALYVMDYYRQVIEHPEWMGDDVIQSGTLYNDSARGRIYRIVPKNAEKPEWAKGLTLGKASSSELVGLLAHKNNWWRMQAQRLLVDRNDRTVIQALETLATTNTSAVGRLHALWTLEGMSATTANVLAAALRDSEPGVRENVIQIAENHLEEMPSITPALLSMVNDSDARVRFQLLCTLGEIPSSTADHARMQILFQDVTDPWIQIAALSAARQAAPLLAEILPRAKSEPDKYRKLVERVSTQVAMNGEAEAIRSTILSGTRSPTPDASVQAAMINGMAIGFENTDRPTLLSPALQSALLDAVMNHDDIEVGKASLRLFKTIDSFDRSSRYETLAMAQATDKSQTDARRSLAVEFLAMRPDTRTRAFFSSLLSAAEPLPVQLSALRSLSAVKGTDVSRLIITRWTTLTPDVHDAAIATFLHDDERIELLLRAVEDHTIPASSISWPRRVTLMAQSNASLRERSRKLFTQAPDENVRRTVDQVLTLQGNAERGLKVFQEQCGLCHQIRGRLGTELGPDLGTVHNWSAEAIVSNIITPNQSISSGYDLCRIELVNGESIQGIITSESPAALTLRNTNTADRVVNRADIKSLETMNMSVMPADFKERIGAQKLADVLAFLKQNKIQ